MDISISMVRMGLEVADAAHDSVARILQDGKVCAARHRKPALPPARGRSLSLANLFGGKSEQAVGAPLRHDECAAPESPCYRCRRRALGSDAFPERGCFRGDSF